MKHREVIEENFWRDMQDAFHKGYDDEKLKQAKNDPGVAKQIDTKTKKRAMDRLKKDIKKFAKGKAIDKATMQQFLKREGFDDEIVNKVGDEVTAGDDDVAIEIRLDKAINASKAAAEAEPEETDAADETPSVQSEWEEFASKKGFSATEDNDLFTWAAKKYGPDVASKAFSKAGFGKVERLAQYKMWIGQRASGGHVQKWAEQKGIKLPEPRSVDDYKLYDRLRSGGKIHIDGGELKLKESFYRLLNKMLKEGWFNRRYSRKKIIMEADIGQEGMEKILGLLGDVKPKADPEAKVEIEKGSSDSSGSSSKGTPSADAVLKAVSNATDEQRAALKAKLGL